jgi:predicted nucleic-acid-binding protein
MIGIDTSVLVRLFVNDTPAQAAAAARVVADAAARGEKITVSPLVLAELCWALAGPYRFSKADLVDALRRLAEDTTFQIADRESVEIAIDAWEAGRADFADYLIAGLARAAGARTTFTFDKEASKMRPALTLLEG